MTDHAEAASLQAARDQPLLGIACKVAATLFFAFMFAAIRWLGPYFPLGEIVFFRSTLGIPVIVAAAYVTGGFSLLATKRIGRQSFVPFGPFLIFGALWGIFVTP